MISKAQHKARIAVCERIAAEGGNIEDAATEMGTIEPNGLYYYLRTHAPETFRRICKKRGPPGTNFTLSPAQSARRIKLIQEYGYTGAARMLGMPSRNGCHRLYSWYKYRLKVGAVDAYSDK